MARYARRSTRRTFRRSTSRPVRRAARRVRGTARRGGSQTVRIVIDHGTPNPAAALGASALGLKPAPGPKKAQF